MKQYRKIERAALATHIDSAQRLALPQRQRSLQVSAMETAPSERYGNPGVLFHENCKFHLNKRYKENRYYKCAAQCCKARPVVTSQGNFRLTRSHSPHHIDKEEVLIHEFKYKVKFRVATENLSIRNIFNEDCANPR